MIRTNINFNINYKTILDYHALVFSIISNYMTLTKFRVMKFKMYTIAPIIYIFSNKNDNTIFSAS